MELTPVVDAEKLYGRVLEALAAGDTQSALAMLERALKQGDNPSWHSYLGYCIAKERGQVKKGSELCLDALKLEPDNCVHHLNLAKVHLIAGQKPEALRVLREAMALGGSAEIVALFGELGARKPSVLPFLSRDNPLNKGLGILFSRLGLR